MGRHVVQPNDRQRDVRTPRSARRRLADQKRGSLRGSCGSSERHHEAVERHDQDLALDALQASGAHDAQDRERSAGAPAPPPALNPRRHLPHAGQVVSVERSRLGVDRECVPVEAIATLSMSPRPR
jgi:hypothetical protein